MYGTTHSQCVYYSHAFDMISMKLCSAPLLIPHVNRFGGCENFSVSLCKCMDNKLRYSQLLIDNKHNDSTVRCERTRRTARLMSVTVSFSSQVGNMLVKLRGSSPA